MTNSAAPQHAEWVGPHGSATASAPVENAVANLDAEIAAIDQLGIAPLRGRWREIHGSEAPARLGSEFLKRALAFHLQEQMLGGLSRQAKFRLKALEKKATGPKADRGRLATPASVKTGSRFLREWKGVTHEVIAIENSQFVYRGTVYRSLSVIAREITGTHQSGPHFFGISLTKSKRSDKGTTDG
ncbi:MAG: DUF2924 domain-containing protein [Aestuariivirga sp.]